MTNRRSALILLFLFLSIGVAWAGSPSEQSKGLQAHQTKTDRPTLLVPDVAGSAATRTHAEEFRTEGAAGRAILWDQPLSAVDQNAYANQSFPDYATYGIYLADDFTNAAPWSISGIFVPGNGWNGFATLACGTGITWSIFADAGGVPDGHPEGGNPPVWTLTLLPSDPQVVLSTGTGGTVSNIQLNLAAPFTLPAGTWWLYCYPTMGFGTCGQYGRQPSDTVNGAVAQVINPGGGFGLGTGFNPYTILGGTLPDLAFRIDGDIGADVSLSGVTYVDACSSGGAGDHDGIADPGENLGITPTALNGTAAALTGVTGALSSPSAGVSIVTPNQTYADIAAGATGGPTVPFSVSLDPALGCGTVLDFQLDVTSNEGAWTFAFSITVGNSVPGGATTLIDEGFEAWPPTSGGAWTFSHTGCGGWEPGTTAGNPNNTGGAGGFADADSDDCGTAMTADMVTPPFSLAGSYLSAQLQFRSDFNDYGNSDDGYVDVSTDGGATWANLFHYAKADFRGPRQETVDLTPYLGNADVRIRFQYVAPGWDWWWQVDDVVVTATAAPTCTMNPCVGGAPCTVTCTASAAPTSGVAPLTVAFTASATLGPTCVGPATYAWDFGDGGTSAEQNPTHIYAAGGTYTWMVTVTVDGVTCTQTGTVTANPFDLNFYDDYGRSALCVNSTSGAFTYWVLRGFGMGPYSGVGTVTRYNGVMYLRTQATSPVYLNLQFMERYRKASASMAYRPGRVTSTLYDSNTTNNPPFCTP